MVRFKSKPLSNLSGTGANKSEQPEMNVGDGKRHLQARYDSTHQKSAQRASSSHRDQDSGIDRSHPGSTHSTAGKRKSIRDSLKDSSTPVLFDVGSKKKGSSRQVYFKRATSTHDSQNDQAPKLQKDNSSRQRSSVKPVFSERVPTEKKPKGSKPPSPQDDDDSIKVTCSDLGKKQKSVTWGHNRELSTDVVPPLLDSQGDEPPQVILVVESEAEDADELCVCGNHCATEPEESADYMRTFHPVISDRENEDRDETDHQRGRDYSKSGSAIPSSDKRATSENETRKGSDVPPRTKAQRHSDGPVPPKRKSSGATGDGTRQSSKKASAMFSSDRKKKTSEKDREATTPSRSRRKMTKEVGSSANKIASNDTGDATFRDLVKGVSVMLSTERTKSSSRDSEMTTGNEVDCYTRTRKKTSHSANDGGRDSSRRAATMVSSDRRNSSGNDTSRHVPSKREGSLSENVTTRTTKNHGRRSSKESPKRFSVPTGQPKEASRRPSIRKGDLPRDSSRIAHTPKAQTEKSLSDGARSISSNVDKKSKRVKWSRGVSLSNDDVALSRTPQDERNQVSPSQRAPMILKRSAFKEKTRRGSTKLTKTKRPSSKESLKTVARSNKKARKEGNLSSGKSKSIAITTGDKSIVGVVNFEDDDMLRDKTSASTSIPRGPRVPGSTFHRSSSADGDARSLSMVVTSQERCRSVTPANDKEKQEVTWVWDVACRPLRDFLVCLDSCPCGGLSDHMHNPSMIDSTPPKDVDALRGDSEEERGLLSLDASPMETQLASLSTSSIDSTLAGEKIFTRTRVATSGHPSQQGESCFETSRHGVRRDGQRSSRRRLRQRSSLGGTMNRVRKPRDSEPRTENVVDIATNAECRDDVPVREVHNSESDCRQSSRALSIVHERTNGGEAVVSVVVVPSGQSRDGHAEISDRPEHRRKKTYFGKNFGKAAISPSLNRKSDLDGSRNASSASMHIPRKSPPMVGDRRRMPRKGWSFKVAKKSNRMREPNQDECDDTTSSDGVNQQIECKDVAPKSNDSLLQESPQRKPLLRSIFKSRTPKADEVNASTPYQVNECVDEGNRLVGIEQIESTTSTTNILVSIDELGRECVLERSKMHQSDSFEEVMEEMRTSQDETEDLHLSSSREKEQADESEQIEYTLSMTNALESEDGQTETESAIVVESESSMANISTSSSSDPEIFLKAGDQLSCMSSMTITTAGFGHHDRYAAAGQVPSGTPEDESPSPLSDEASEASFDACSRSLSSGQPDSVIASFAASYRSEANVDDDISSSINNRSAMEMKARLSYSADTVEGKSDWRSGSGPLQDDNAIEGVDADLGANLVAASFVDKPRDLKIHGNNATELKQTSSRGSTSPAYKNAFRTSNEEVLESVGGSSTARSSSVSLSSQELSQHHDGSEHSIPVPLSTTSIPESQETSSHREKFGSTFSSIGLSMSRSSLLSSRKSSRCETTKPPFTEMEDQIVDSSSPQHARYGENEESTSLASNATHSDESELDEMSLNTLDKAHQRAYSLDFPVLVHPPVSMKPLRRAGPFPRASSTPQPITTTYIL